MAAHAPGPARSAGRRRHTRGRFHHAWRSLTSELNQGCSSCRLRRRRHPDRHGHRRHRRDQCRQHRSGNDQLGHFLTHDRRPHSEPFGRYRFSEIARLLVGQGRPLRGIKLYCLMAASVTRTAKPYNRWSKSCSNPSATRFPERNAYLNVQIPSRKSECTGRRARSRFNIFRRSTAAIEASPESSRT